MKNEKEQDNPQSAVDAENDNTATDKMTEEPANNETRDTLNDDTETEKKELQEESKSKNKFFGKKTSKEDKLKEQVTELEIKNHELNDKFLRLYSEFDNYKKRSNKEKLELISTASEKVLVEILPIIDDFERAIKANEQSEDIKTIRSGFELIYNKTIQLLKRFDVEEIAAQGEKFDTDLHEAIAHLPAQEENEKGMVKDVTEKGYKIKNKVIRYSKVVVAN